MVMNGLGATAMIPYCSVPCAGTSGLPEVCASNAGLAVELAATLAGYWPYAPLLRLGTTESRALPTIWTLANTHERQRNLRRGYTFGCTTSRPRQSRRHPAGKTLQKDTFRRTMEPHLRGTGTHSSGTIGRPSQRFSRAR
jgi:hypothetical protein